MPNALHGYQIFLDHLITEDATHFYVENYATTSATALAWARYAKNGKIFRSNADRQPADTFPEPSTLGQTVLVIGQPAMF